MQVMFPEVNLKYNFMQVNVSRQNNSAARVPEWVSKDANMILPLCSRQFKAISLNKSKQIALQPVWKIEKVNEGDSNSQICL